MNFFVNEAMGMGNSGVEHAQFYRAKRFKQAGIPYKFIFTELVTNLHEAMDKWKISDDEVINMWEFFVLGNDYARDGLYKRTEPSDAMTIDGSNTNRLSNTVTISGLRVIKHFVKYPDPKKEHMLLVSLYRVEIFDVNTNRKKVMYEVLEDAYESFRIRNINLYDQPDGKHLFFENSVQLRRYFYHRIEKIFVETNNFFIDRGEPNEVALLDEDFGKNRRIIEIVHADHLSDRDDPKNPLWNNYYEYALTHLEKVDRLVVATELQRQDLLIDFPSYQNKIVTIPVGGVSDKKSNVAKYQKHDELRLVTISRLAEEKHIDLIVQAVVNLRQNGMKVQLDIYGAGEQKTKLTDLIAKSQAGGYIKLKGLTHHASKIYPKYDAFISASFSEGFGLTYIEALNAGLPVVTFKARFGALEMIKDNYNGYLYDFKRNDEAYNIKQLENGIRKLTTMDVPAMRVNVLRSVDGFRDQLIADKWRKLINGL